MVQEAKTFFTHYWDRAQPKVLPRVIANYGSRKAAKEAAQEYVEKTGFPCSVGHYRENGIKVFEGRYRMEKKHGLVYRPFVG